MILVLEEDERIKRAKLRHWDVCKISHVCHICWGVQLHTCKVWALSVVQSTRVGWWKGVENVSAAHSISTGKRLKEKSTAIGVILIEGPIDVCEIVNHPIRVRAAKNGDGDVGTDVLYSVREGRFDSELEVRYQLWWNDVDLCVQRISGIVVNPHYVRCRNQSRVNIFVSSVDEFVFGWNTVGSVCYWRNDCHDI